ncbi:MAG TPA: glycosyltransferase family 39 protein, partial [Rhizomicrobium sp.]
MTNKIALSAFKLVVFGTALFCVFAFWRTAISMGLRLPLGPNEGWNAYHAAAAMSGGPLYPGPHSMMINNYPPLSFYLIGAFGRVLDDNILAGRIVSLLSFFLIILGIFAAALRLGCKRLEASFAALLFAGGMLVFTDYVGMNDPQMLAHAIAMAGFLLLLKAPRGTVHVALAALLFVLAVFVKHNVIAMALAATVWLIDYDRKNALRLAGLGVAFLLAGLVLFRLIYGTGLLAELISARIYSIDNLHAGFDTWLRWSLVPLVGLTVLASLRWPDRYVRLVSFYAAAGTILGLCFLGGAGVDANAMFDADIALALGAALLVQQAARGAFAPVTAAAYVLPLLLGAWTNAGWRDAHGWLHPMREETAAAQKDIAFLAARPGPALCEMQSFCYWARKPAAVDVFNLSQQFATGARSDAK